MAQHRISTFISEAFMLALATGAIYAYAYTFEFGYALVFRYPPELIGPTLHSLLGGWVLSLLAAIFGFLQLNFQYWPSMKKWIAGFIATLIVYVFLALIFIAMLPQWATSVVVGLAALVGIAVNWIYGRQTRNALKKEYEKMNSATTVVMEDPEFVFSVYDKNTNVPKYSIAHAVIKRFGRDPLVYFFLFFLVVPFLCLVAGGTQAIGERDFYLLKNIGSEGQPELVLRIVSGTVISVPFDQDSQLFCLEFRVRDASALAELGLTPIHFDGPLQFRTDCEEFPPE